MLWLLLLLNVENVLETDYIYCRGEQCSYYSPSITMEVRIVDAAACQNHYLTRNAAKRIPKREVSAPAYMSEDGLAQASEVVVGCCYRLVMLPTSGKCEKEAWSFQVVDVWEEVDEDDCYQEEHAEDCGEEDHKISIWRDKIMVEATGTDEKLILEGCARNDVCIQVLRGSAGCHRCDVLWLKVEYFGHDAHREEAFLPLFITDRSDCECGYCSSNCDSEMSSSEDEEERSFTTTADQMETIDGKKVKKVYISCDCGASEGCHTELSLSDPAKDVQKTPEVGEPEEKKVKQSDDFIAEIVTCV
jgi:hypothetical protein